MSYNPAVRKVWRDKHRGEINARENARRGKYRDEINARQKLSRDKDRIAYNAGERRRRAGKKEHEASKRKRYYENRCALLIELKSKPCTDCRLSFPAYVMDFDHVRGEKEFGIAHGIHTYTLDEVLLEIAKCDLVCSNCHRIRTHTR